MSIIGLFITSSLFLVITIVLAGFLTYVERKVIAKIQCRIGPNVTGPQGLLQPIADVIKLVHKEVIIPKNSNKVLFLIAPTLILVPALLSVAVIPVVENVVVADLNLGLLYLLAVSSFGIYGMLLTAWSSNSNYSILGGLRAVVQMISYEIPLSFVLLCAALLAGSFNLTDIVNAQNGLWNIIPLFPLFIIFMLCIFAKTHRAPFDLPEAENELVAGYNTEYSSSLFAMIFLGEYVNMLVFSALGVIVFFGGWLPLFAGLYFIPAVIWFVLKVGLLIMVFLISRTLFPRIRFDHLLELNWKVFMPICLFYFIALAIYVQFFRS